MKFGKGLIYLPKLNENLKELYCNNNQLTILQNTNKKFKRIIL